jgi:hypothetical protein
MQPHPWSRTRTLGELKAACQSYRNPDLVEDIVLTLVLCHPGLKVVDTVSTKLAEGLKLGEVLLALWRNPFAKLTSDDARERRCRDTLIAILSCEDFIIKPRIDGPIGVITRCEEGVIGVELYTDNDILRGDRLPLLRLLSPSSDAESAPVQRSLEEVELAEPESKPRKKGQGRKEKFPPPIKSALQKEYRRWKRDHPGTFKYQQREHLKQRALDQFGIEASDDTIDDHIMKPIDAAPTKKGGRIAKALEDPSPQTGSADDNVVPLSGFDDGEY